ncbi:tripartite tricarboxylate transporter TctB family protein [Chloroflexota bacterium]
MKFPRGWSFWFSLLLLILALMFVGLSFSYKPEGRLVPLIVGIPTLILAILVVLSERYPRLIRVFDVNLEDMGRTGLTEAVAIEESMPKENYSGQKLRNLLIWIFGLFLLIFFVGYVIAVPLYLFLFLKFFSRASWLKTTIITLVMASIVYGGFEVGMRGNLFEGILFGAFLPPI